ncbi:LCP family protein [[Eubacterium] hominis]|uniref:LCP family glycopolymer transferase n=1 Tax=[Eubacterium] hominis TaxID=2764325 RepID=UPI003A4DF775
MKSYLQKLKSGFLYKVILGLTLVLMCIMFYAVYSLFQYKVSYALIMLFITFLCTVILFLVQFKKPKLTCILQIILCILLLVCSLALHKVNTVTNKLSDTTEYQTIQIIAKADSKISTLSNFTSYQMAYDQNDSNGYDYAKEILDEHKIVLKNLMPVESTKKSYELLKNNKVDLMVLTSIGRSELEEETTDLDKEIKVIFEKKVEMKQAQAKHVDITKDPFTLYICGTDLSGINDVGSTGRGDVNILLTINPTTKKVNLQVVPRDLFVYIPVKDASSKLSYSGWWGGVESSIASIEQALDIDINYYVKMNFTGLMDLVDALGGVDVYSHYTYTPGGFTINEGMNYVNGKQALAFARERKSLPLNERSRGYQQMELIKAIFTKFGEEPSYDHAMKVIDSISNNFTTNLPKSDFCDACMLVIDLLPQLQNMEVHSIEGEYKWHMDEVRTADYLYYFYPADGEIEKVKGRIIQTKKLV